ncbi:cytochrome c oxidase assembly factor 1 homolog isoform X2 [Myotis daubentonii]|uniref:cytochrome c oxidase assembly factor 1 homolog isoform X2 n=1 Tax=Myotis daubentonii TaxID=98922 RepID=UPI002873E51C|nr:cytochrome c oxidase assembly factor 1 homolog isoform X2 [Myotis daubentonii]
MAMERTGQISFDDFQESRVTQWQKALGSRMPQVPLGKVILYTSVMTSGGCALVYYLTQTFSRASYYQLALEQLHGHPEALEALGTPLNTHHLQLMDKYNFVDIADAKLKIPVSGSKSAGHLYVISSREAPFKSAPPTFQLRQCEEDLLKRFLIVHVGMLRKYSLLYPSLYPEFILLSSLWAFSFCNLLLRCCFIF